MGILEHRRQRTVVVVNDFGSIVGGAGKVAVDSALGLANRGFDVIYFCAVGPVDRRLREGPLKIVCLGQYASLDNPSWPEGALQNLWNWEAERRLSEVLAACDRTKTVVHVHSWSKALSPSCFKAMRSSELATAITIHDYFMACPNGGLFNYQTRQVCSLRPMSRPCLTSNCDKQSYAMKLFRVLRQSMLNSAMERPRAPWHFVAVSDFALQKIGAYLPAWAGRSLVPNPVDLEQMAPVDPAKSDCFISVGRLSPEKGTSVFAMAARLAGVRAAIIGAGEMHDEVIAANPFLEMLGWLDHADMLERLRKARALVFPSLCPEPLGLSPLEAAAHGIPSIVSDNTGACDWIVDGKNGLHFVTGDIESLADKLVRMRDDSLVSRLGSAAYDNHWRNAPSLAKHVDNLEKLYNEMLRLPCGTIQEAHSNRRK